MRSTDLIEKYRDWSRIAHIEETSNYPGLVYIQSASSDMPFALMDDIRTHDELYVWQSLSTRDGHAAIFVGEERE